MLNCCAFLKLPKPVMECLIREMWFGIQKKEAWVLALFVRKIFLYTSPATRMRYCLTMCGQNGASFAHVSKDRVDLRVGDMWFQYPFKTSKQFSATLANAEDYEQVVVG